jgi:hypothetical protein
LGAIDSNAQVVAHALQLALKSVHRESMAFSIGQIEACSARQLLREWLTVVV